jgi:hypothetical protein
MFWFIFAVFWFLIRATLAIGRTAARTLTPPRRASYQRGRYRRNESQRPDRGLAVLVGIPAVIVGGMLLILAVALIVECFQGNPGPLLGVAAFSFVVFGVLGALAFIGLKTTPKPKPSSGWHGQAGHSCPNCPDPNRPIGPKDAPARKPPPDDAIERLPLLRKPRRTDDAPYKWRPYQQPLIPDYDPDQYDNGS